MMQVNLNFNNSIVALNIYNDVDYDIIVDDNYFDVVFNDNVRRNAVDVAVQNRSIIRMMDAVHYFYDDDVCRFYCYVNNNRFYI